MSDNEEEVPGRSEEEITKEVEEKCWNAFNSVDKEGNGSVNSSDVKTVLELMDVKMDEDDVYRMITDIDPENTGVIGYQDFKPRICTMEINKLKGSDDSELLDAYVAMGGDADGGGCVDAKVLIDTIKYQF